MDEKEFLETLINHIKAIEKADAEEERQLKRIQKLFFEKLKAQQPDHPWVQKRNIYERKKRSRKTGDK
jgi:hypothetical protein